MKDKKNIILVGSRGEVAKILMEVIDHDKYSLIKTSSKPNLKDIYFCDLKSRESIDSFLDKIKNMKIFLLTINASITPNYYKNVDPINFDLLSDIFLINCTSLVYFVEKINELNIEIKKILIVSSITAYFPSNKHIAYNASKSAQLSIFNSIKKKYPKKQISIFLLSSKGSKLDRKRIKSEYSKLLHNDNKNSKVINFAYRKTIIFFIKKIIKNII